LDKRRITQMIAALLTNANVKGFLQGTIYKGKGKRMCVPGLNCYSCPGAMGSCPIGSLQAVIGSFKYKISFYVIGILSFVGVMFGRFICGWLCPFGLLQDLLYKIPASKFKVNPRIDRILRYLKYVILLVFVILMPLFLVNEFGMSPPYFCKYICPAGTLEGGIPLISANESLRSTLGFLFTWKMFLLICIVLLSVFTYRPFCKYICPLGAFYALFHKISFVQLKIDENKCIHCSKCTTACKMEVDVCENPSSAECIRCGDCVKACPADAVSINIGKFAVMKKNKCDVAK
jgi:ferredoxin-type protein NapH